MRRLIEDSLKGVAFTLIELLVVVAIIAVLVAVLLPALQRARDQAKAAVCLANVKSQASAVMMYEMDYGVYPPVCWGDWQSPYDRTTWASFIYSYLAGGAKVRTMVPGAWWPDGLTVGRLKSLLCPSATAACLFFPAPPEGGVHYAYSEIIHQMGFVDGDIYDTIHWLRLNSFSRPAEIRMLCDAPTYFTHYCPICAPAGWSLGVNEIPAFGRHVNGLNVGAWDGHAGFVSNGDIESNPTLCGHNGL